MKLATFEVRTPIGRSLRVGAAQDESIVDLRAALADLVWQQKGRGRALAIADATIGSTMIEFLEGGPYAREAAEAALEHASTVEIDRENAFGQRLKFGYDDVRLRAPIPRPNTLRDYTGFREHLEEFFSKVDLPDPSEAVFRERPMYYKANADMVLGPDDVVPWSRLTDKLDFEIEPVVVIGQRCVDVSAEAAMDYVAGYTILNDVSLRDYQLHEMAIPVNLYGVSKSKDAGTYPMGPWIVTPDEVDAAEMTLIVRVNGEEWVRESTRSMTWSFADMISFSSIDEPLLPGDCLAGGAPPRGCGADIGRWIAPGDVIECEIEGIGVLRNRVGERSGSGPAGDSEAAAAPVGVATPNPKEVPTLADGS